MGGGRGWEDPRALQLAVNKQHRNALLLECFLVENNRVAPKLGLYPILK